MPERALLLAAGLGKRLQPLTAHIPKCLVPIRGRPLLEFWLDALTKADFGEITVNTHYLADLVQEYLVSHPHKHLIRVAHEERLLGTAGTILRNKKLFDKGRVLVAHADNLTSFDPGEFVRSHELRPRGCVMTMMTFVPEDPWTCGIVELDGNGIVRKFHEKVAQPPGNIANAAVYMIEPEVIHFMEAMQTAPTDLSTQVVPNLMGRIYAVHNPGFHRDIGTPESFKSAQLDFTGPLPSFPEPDPWRALVERDGGKLAHAINACFETPLM